MSLANGLFCFVSHFSALAQSGTLKDVLLAEFAIPGLAEWEEGDVAVLDQNCLPLPVRSNSIEASDKCGVCFRSQRVESRYPVHCDQWQCNLSDSKLEFYPGTFSLLA